MEGLDRYFGRASVVELTFCNLPARATFPFAICQYAPARKQKPRVRVRKMMKKKTFVRSEQIMYMKQRKPM